MAGNCLQLLRGYRLKDPIQQASRDKVFVDYKRFNSVTRVVNYEEVWDLVFAVDQALYPAYRMLRLSDMKYGGQDKMKYYVCQADRLIKPAFQNVLDKWNAATMPRDALIAIKLSDDDKNFLSSEYIIFIFV